MITKKKESAVSNEICSSEATNNFWSIASRSIQSISENERAEDGTKHWILYLESELRKISDPKKLKRIQREIINLIDDADNN